MELSVRAFAEMMVLPGYEQERILYEQKYPQRGPNAFRVPYYRPALGAIREYFRSANDDSSLREAIINLQTQSDGNPGRLRHNVRVIEAFRQGSTARRHLEPVTIQSVRSGIQGVTLRMTPDLVARENEELVYMFFNCRNAAVGEEVARYTLELSQWMLAENGLNVPMGRIEYADLSANERIVFARRRQRTLDRASSNARVVKALWPTL